MLDRPEKDIRIEAVNAIGQLANSESADSLKERLKSLATGADETIARVAAQAMSRIESISGTGRGAPEVRSDTPGEAVKTLLVDNAQVEAMVKNLDQAIKLDVSTLKTGDSSRAATGTSRRSARAPSAPWCWWMTRSSTNA
jgi:hypothetical protein